MDPRPTIHCLIAWPLPDGECILSKYVVSLAEAADYQSLGFMVLVDPLDEAKLARWEQLNRKPKWNRW